MQIYFCQTCKDRMHQAIETLPLNLQTVNSFNALPPVRGHKRAEFKFIVVDYGDPDEIHRHIISTYHSSYTAGQISAFHVPAPPAWRMATVKNIAVRCGIFLGADYVVSLDIDNFITHEELYLLSSLAQHGTGYHGIRDIYNGTAGRIGCSSEQFTKMNGFREDSPPAGRHDFDFVKRLSKERDVVHLPSLRSPIRNPKIETIKHTELNNRREYRQACHSNYSTKVVPTMPVQRGDLYHQGDCTKDIEL